MNNSKCEILKNSKRIAIVGISRNPSRISRNIAEYLKVHGFHVVGVNPNISFTEADGITVYNNLSEIPYNIDIVNVFRNSEDIPDLIDDIISINPKTLWLQLGIRNDQAVSAIKELGINVIQDSCIKVDHSYCV